MKWTDIKAHEMGETAIRVLFAADHRILCAAVARMLNAEPDIEVVGQASDGLDALEQARQLRPDVVVMDLTMPRLNGIEATRRITAEMPDVRVVALSMHDHADAADVMLEAGAAAYVTKGAPSETLLSAIRRAERE
jgi:two-component system, NarL family, response regulator NreC